MAEEEGDDGVLAEAESALSELKSQAAKQQLESLLSGEADSNDCFLEVHAGAGGTESQDWAEMLARMYARWADQHSCKIEQMEESPGEEAGIKSCVIEVQGPYAYGYLKSEIGVVALDINKILAAALYILALPEWL